jgi:FtsP/CotA-like multicopper oxidase with cupredoxin domain
LAATLLGPPRASAEDVDRSLALVAAAPDGVDAARRFAFNGTTPGPLIRVRRGMAVAVKLENRLPVATAVHWHGVRNNNAMDGVAGLTQDAVAPGASFDYGFTARDAGTFWYHPVFPERGDARTPGLYGLLVVEETNPPEVDRDVAMVIDNWTSARQDITLAPHERIRIRLLNAASDRMATLAFAGFEPFVVALDGQPTNEAFVPAGHRLDLPPGGRADILLDAPPVQGGRAGIALRDVDTIIEIASLAVRPGNPIRPSPLPRPGALEANDLPAEIALASARNVEIALDGKFRSGISPQPLFSVARGTPVTLALANRAAVAQVAHVHGHAFRLLHPFDDGWEPYWLDTVVVDAAETVRIAFLADNPGKWLLGTQPIDTVPGGSAGWFEVLP